MKLSRSTAWMLLAFGVSTLHFAVADIAAAQSPAPASPFGLLPGEFAIRTSLTKNYLTARDGGHHSIDAVITSATTLGPNEKFKLSKVAPNLTAIQTPQGYYVSAVGGGGLDGTGPFPASRVLQTERTALADDALFTMIVNQDFYSGTTAIMTFNGHFLTALGGGGKATDAFHTNATVRNTWEIFHLLKSGDLGSGFRYAIRVAGDSNSNFHFRAAGGGGTPPPYLAIELFPLRPESHFTLLRLADGSYALECANGANFVTAVGGGGLANGDNLHTDATRIGSWEKFKILDQGDATYTIQTVSGFYLGVKPHVEKDANGDVLSYGEVSTRISDPNAAPSIGYTAKFELTMIDP